MKIIKLLEARSNPGLNTKQEFQQFIDGVFQKNAEALYWQSDTLTVIDNKDPFCDYFIIRVKWNENVQNNKETDMVYLTVQRK